jgi:molecular chaperone GrpE
MSDHPRRSVDGRAVRASHGEPPSPAGETPPDAAVAAATALEAVTAEDVESLRAELTQRSDQLLRLAADFENFRRRKAQELADGSRYASEDAARALLPVLDNLRRAVGHSPGDGGGQQLLDGLRMVVIQFEQALSAIGVEPVETVGARFDPAVHEAIGGEESDEVSEDMVVAEMQPGYRLLDRLLRPALVRVVHPRRGGGAPAGPEV